MPGEIIEGFRLSPQQKYLWDRQKRSLAFRAQCAVLLSGQLERRLIREAIEKVVQRHEILRTAFESLPGMDIPMQVVAEQAVVDCPEIDLTAYSAKEQEGQIEALFRREGGLPFHFDRAPLARFSLLLLSADQSVLLMSLPAVCADSRSLENLLDEIVLAYATVSGGAEEPGDEPVQYIQFSEWQNEVPGLEESAAGLQFWRDQKIPADAMLSLPDELAVAGAEDFRLDDLAPDTLVHRLSFPVSRDLERAARQSEASLSSWLLTAWQVLLWRLSGETDVVVASLYDGRKFEELRQSLGLFASYLPVFTRIRPAERFSRLLARVSRLASDIESWQECFDWENGAWSRGAAPGPIGFDLAERVADRSVNGTRFSVRRWYVNTGHFKLRLSVSRSGDAMDLELHYAPPLYERVAMQRLLERFETLLESAAADPEQAVGELEIMPMAERRRLVAERNATAAEVPFEGCVHTSFERQAERSPDELAVCFEGESLSFRELNERANRLAHRLRAEGVGAESCIGLCLERSVDQIVALLAALKAGGAYLPLDPLQPPDRLALMVEDAAVRIVLTQERLRGRLPQTGALVLSLDGEMEAGAELGDWAAANPLSDAAPDNAAYVLYTSGSTGRPKGVMIRHRSVVNLAWALKTSAYAGLNAELLRVSVNAPLTFDASVKQWVQLLLGHTLILVPEEIRRDGEELLRFVLEERLDVLDCTPSQLRLLVSAGLFGHEAGSLPRRYLVGGEAVAAGQWMELASVEGRPFFNVYGPTECTVDAAVCRVDQGPARPTIGRAIANVRLYVMEEDLSLALDMAAGELWIGGAGLARGYLGRPDLTAEKFVPDPFGESPGGRLYRTGDLVRYLPDGNLEFLGRIDHQVKIRGFRVELGEVEAALASCPGVRQAVVVLRDDPAGEKRLVGYVSLKSDDRMAGPARHLLPNGLAVFHQNRNETDYLYEEIFRKEAYFQHGIALPENACVFDVGANIGMFTLFVGQRCPSARVYAFEPIGPIFEALRGNAELYGPEVRLFRHGLSQREQTAQFTFYPRYTMMSGLAGYAVPEDEVEVVKRFLRNEEERGSSEASALLAEADELLAGRFRAQVEECRLRRLSDVIREEGVERIDLLKVDVQRAEMDVLAGLDEADWAKVSQVVMEVHDASGTESEGRCRELRDLLAGHGFEVVIEQDELLIGTDRYNLFARRHGLRIEPSRPAAALPEAPVDGAPPTPSDLRDRLREKLPEHMVPSAVVLLEQFPLTRNGKVDRAALPAPEEVLGDRQEDLTAPRNLFEEVLVGLWSDLLRVERVGTDQGFFDLGGHSLLATQLMSRVREAFRIDLPLRTLFEEPTVAGLAARIEHLLRTDEGVQAPPIVPVPREGELPLSFAQQRLWFLHQLEPGSAFYNNPMALRLQGPLNPAVLAATLSEVVRRHEVLRTRFATTEGRPSQVIMPPREARLPVVDLSSLPGEVREAHARQLASEEALRPFHLAEGPLLRSLLLRLDVSEHAALFSLHHIVSDAWSLGILAREVSALYASLSAGERPVLPDLPVQYADYAVWQRSWLSGEVLETELSYWRERLRGLPPFLELPTDHPRPAVQTYRGSQRPVAVSEPLAAALQEISRREGGTLFMTLLAGIQILLSRYSGEDDVAVGSPIAGRNRLETEGLIGFFVNTLVLRGRLEEAPSFRHLLARVREEMLGAYAHQDLPFEKLVDELQPERSLAYAPLFQVMFSFQNVERGGLELPGLRIEPLGFAGQNVKFDLELLLLEDQGILRGALDFNTDLFDPATADRLLGHLVSLLAAAVAEPDLPLLELSLLSGEEKRHILHEWNQAPTEILYERSFHDLFRARARAFPNATAATCGKDSLTYAELDQRSDGLAGALQAAGVRPGSLVALLAERGLDFLTAMVAVFKAGAAYVPLDPLHPPRRLAQVLEQSSVPLVLAGRELVRMAGEICADLPERPRALELDDLIAGSSGGAAPRVETPPDQLAYVIFTSGSTGVPKGAMVHQRGMLNHLRVKIHDLGLSASDVVAQTASQTFDISVWQFLAALLAGGRVEILPTEVTQDPARLLDDLARSGVTILETVPSLLGFLLEEVRVRGERPALDALRWLIPTGEALPPDLCRRWLAVYPEVPLLNAYGPTECSDDVTHHAILQPPPAGAMRVPIGRPVLGMRLYVLDRAYAPLPAGVPGELYVGGTGVGRGYLNGPRRTAEVFVPDPWGPLPGDRLYRTGDLVRYLPDGVLDFLGRIDHQVKIRGFRIELGEIEKVLADVSGAREVAVLVRTGHGTEPRLVAYVASTDGAYATSESLRVALRERLPEHMMPAGFVFLEKLLPRLPSGKLDRRALPEPEVGAAGDVTAPRTVVEELLAEVWIEVLQVEGVGAEDSFFALGGHSLLATQVVSRVRRVFGVELGLREVFEAPRLASLARRIEAALQRDGAVEMPPLVRVDRQGSLPLSFAQQRLWFLDQLEPGSSTYNMPVALRLDGALRVEVLEAALKEIVRRHESLRTRFELVEREPVQVIAETARVRLPLVDLGDLARPLRERESRRLALAEARLPFDLGRGPLFRASLLRLDSEQHVLLATLHHIVSDGWSMDVLRHEITSLYQSFDSGVPSPLPELIVQYADYAAWQRSWLRGEVLESELSYWRGQMAGMPPILELSTDRPRPAVRSSRGSHEDVRLSADLSGTLMNLARGEGSTAFMMLLAAFQVLLSRTSGQEDFSVGTPTSGRTRLETEGLIGFFVNTLVLRTDLSGHPPFLELLGRVRERLLRAQPHQELPFEKLVEELAPQRSLSSTPLFQVMFTLQNAPREELALPGIRLSTFGAQAHTAKFDLALALAESPGGLHGVLEYSTDLFDASTIRRMAGHFRTLLEEIAAGPGRPLRALPMLGEAERHQLLHEWKGAVPPPEPDPDLSKLFTAQAERTPDAVALVDGDASLRYAELERQSNRLAHALRRLGAGPEVTVAIRLERSLELVTALLAVFKAGAAYLPIDPVLPRERQELLLRDGGTRILVTEGSLDELPGRELPAIVLDRDRDAIAGESDAAPISGAQAHHAAYLIYTSGSTGKPKAVIVERGHLAAVLLASRRSFGWRMGDRMPCLAPFSFDIFLFELFGPLLSGGTSVLFPLRPTLDLPSLVAKLGEMTVLHAVPALLRQVVDTARQNGRVYHGIRAVFVGGDVVPADLLADLRGVFPRAENRVLYGPTETTIICSSFAVPPDDPRPLLGRPLEGVSLDLRDSEGNLVPLGVPGEIWIGGLGVSRGYLNREDLTREKFVTVEGQRFYRSGDLALRLPDGQLEFRGRADQQVKIRGFRIEPGEIEAVLTAHPRVSQTVVLAQKDAFGTLRLVAWFVADGAGPGLAIELRELARRQLPEYMVPSVFVPMESLPLTAHGKVDRRALPDPEAFRPELAMDFEAPRTPVEELIATVWCEVLGLERVGRQDSFFELGGHSLLATQVVSRLRQTLGAEIPLRTLFEAPRLAGLAAAVEGSLRAGTGVQWPPLKPISRDQPLPLSFAQQRLWFLDRFAPGGALYNIPVALRLRGMLDIEALEGAISEIARRHETLRTTFSEVGGNPVQVIAPAGFRTLPVVDLGILSAALREAEALRLASEEARRPFDLDHGPLFRAALLRLKAEDHLLLATIHHIVSDGWSMGVLVREVAALHEALSASRPANLPELPVQYADFAWWQREWLQGEVLEAQLSYWRNQLAEAPRILELPLDRPRPAVQTFRGASLGVALPEGLSAMVHGLCRREGVTPFMVLLASWAVLLGRHTGQEKVLLGTPIAGRNHQAIEVLIGFFANTLVLAVDLSGSPGFSGLLGRARQAALDGFAHQDVPFERLVETLVPERDLAHSPLFQVLLVLQNAPVHDLSIPGLSMAPLRLESGVANFDLTLSFGERRDRRFEGTLEYNIDLFDGSTVARLWSRFMALLEAVATDPEIPLSEVPLLLPSERHQVLVEWADTSRDYVTGVCLHDLVAWQALRTPGSTAALFEDRALSYQELDCGANRLAHHLISLGVRPDDRVGVLMERSLEMIVALLGILKAGAAYVPLDPSWPSDRLAVLVQSSTIGVVVAQALQAHLLTGRGERIVLLDEGWEEIESQPDTAPAVQVGEDHMAYVLFTSGSTGTPKGVMISHRGIVNRLLWMQEAYSLGPEDRVLQKTPFSFDVSLWEFFWPLLVGARLVFARPEGHKDPVYLVDLISREAITTVHFVPSMLQVFLDAPGVSELSSLRLVIASGESLPLDLVRRFFSRVAPGAGLHNLYGPTEASVDVSFWKCRPEDSLVPIGRPIANLRLYVADRNLRLQPPGAPGELLLGGVGLARGYLGRPDLTAASFVPDPFGTEAGERLYRTGDLARVLPDGQVDVLGRIDHQVKIRGFRIELGEIEAVLASHPAVRESVVLVQGTAESRRLAAYVTGNSESPPQTGELRALLSARLPEYMVPAVFVHLDALPLTPNGKVDRQALGRIEARRGKGEAGGARTEIEEILAGIWAEVLRLERVDSEESFFELGGHSLLAVQVTSRVRQAFGIDLPIRALFEAPRLSALARVIEAALRQGSSEAPPLVRASRARPLPLSFAQERLWFLNQLEPDSAAYNIPLALPLGGVEPGVLAVALSELVRRHEVLRTIFTAESGEPVQVIQPPTSLPLPVVDLGALPEVTACTERERLVREEAVRPFDLTCDPVLRTALLQCGATEQLLMVTMHHIASDGWSLGIFERELPVLYNAFQQGRPAHLAELPVQYADYSIWQRGWLTGEALQHQVEFWKRRLAGMPPLLDLSTDRPRPLVWSGRGASLPVHLPQLMVEPLRALARQEGATLFITVLAGFHALLSRYSGQSDISVGTPVAGRNRLELENLIGFFVNTLVIRADLSDAPSFRELLKRTRESVLDAQTHSDLPFEKLVEELAPERSLSWSPLFQVLFLLAPRKGRVAEVESLKTEAAGQDATASPRLIPVKYDLTLDLQETGKGLVGSLRYNSDLFDGSTILRLRDHWERLLNALAVNPEHSFSTRPWLSASERQQLLVEWNEARPAPAMTTVPERFTYWVEQRPEWPAVAFEDEILTYRELDRRANLLAHRLRELGVRPDCRVALLAERSLELIIGLLAILKAGGAYVPLELDSPRERLATLLLDAGVTAVVTQVALALERPEGEMPVVLLDEDSGPGDEESPPIQARPGHLAYVIYTSGSTGIPKGVAVEHQQLSSYLEGVTTRMDLPRGSSYALVSTPAADLGHTVIFASLWTGGVLHIISRQRLSDPEALAEHFSRHPVDCLKLVPSHLSALLTARSPERVLPRQLLILGGEAARWSLIDRVRGLAPQCRILNHYGPTETTVGVLSLELDESARHGAAAPPLGRPFKGVRAHVLDAALELSPPGIPGELYIGGHQVARGYLARPAVTGERFIPDRFAKTPGARLYRTGDRVRHLPDGRVEFLGRVDAQVKVRGFRIEPGEIESVLRSLVEVHDAAVFARDNGAGSPSLVACVVPAVGSGLSMMRLRAALRQRLPLPLIPSEVLLVKALPLTPNGKLDRRALLRLQPDSQEASGEVRQPPSTHFEEVLVNIWTEVLGLATVGVDESFFDVGGHSLLAIQVVSRLRQALGVELPVRALFDAPTIAALAKVVEALLREGGAEAPPLVRVRRDGDLPLSFAQQRLWFLQQLDPGSSAYNVPSRLTLKPDLNVSALAASLSKIVQRHAVLRTRFVTSDGVASQVIDPPGPHFLQVVDLGALPSGFRETEFRRLDLEDTRRPFDLERGPVLRTLLLGLGDQGFQLLATMHHTASDGWSRRIFATELQALYEGSLTQTEVHLPELPVQYADYAVWQRGWLQGETLENQLAFWRRQLAGAPLVLDLPTDRPRPTVWSGRGASVPVCIPEAVAASLRQLARREGATLFIAALAGFQALLSRYSGQRDVSVGTPVSGRNHLELENLIGFFVNTLVIRVDLAEVSFRTLLGRTREAVLDAQAHQDLPFEKLVEELSPERSLAWSPLFQVLFTLDPAGRNAQPSGELLGTAEGLPRAVSRTVKFDVSLDLQETRAGLVGSIQYNSDLFDTSTVLRLRSYWERLLSGLAADPELSLSELPLLLASERHQALVEWADTARDYGTGVCLHDLVARQVQRTPDSTAASFEGRELSYQDLDRRANRLAHHLIDLGVRPDDRVGVLMERSLEMIVGLLGILKAGAAYVPLDPSWPADRLAVLVESSGIGVVVGQAKQAHLLPGYGERIILIDEGWQEIESQPGTAPVVPVGEEHLAYVLFTSGSTGTPKGVMISHRGIVNRLLWMQEAYVLGPEDRVLQKTPFSFDVSLWEFFWPLLVGARLVFARPEGHKDPAYLVELISREAITTLHFVPSMLQVFLEASGVPDLSSLRLVIASGESLPLDLVRRFFSRRPAGAGLHNLYGPTEASVDVSFWECEPEPPRSVVPIGRPIANLRLYVTDRDLWLQPPGTSGELLLGGVGLARGYLGRPELTAAAFVPDPFGSEPGGRLYRTGDLARVLPDGQVDVLGRIDHQVKIRGFRIELGEIEAVLASHPAVRESVVLALGDASGSGRLVAYVSGNPEALPQTVELRAFLASRLPEYMVPTVFIPLDMLPLTPNGKVDRQALGRIATAWREREGPGPQTAPRDAVELALTLVWEELLGVQPIGVNENFFELGGHSLLAVTLMSRIRRQLGSDLRLAALFENPTIELLATRLRRQPEPREPSRLVSLQASVPASTEPPLVFVHPVGGQVFCYLDLARHLGPDQPFYAVQAKAGAEARSIESLAVEYLEELQAAWPTGPYRLGGWSMGGVVAYEMARQLTERGETVDLLALVDGMIWSGQEQETDGLAGERQVLLEFARDLMGISGRDLSLLPLAELASLPPLEALRRAVQEAQAVGILPAGFELTDALEHLEVFKANRAALASYVPRPYAGKLTLFRCEGGARQRSADLGWGSRAESLDVESIPGDHYTALREPHVGVLGSLLSSRLRK